MILEKLWNWGQESEPYDPGYEILTFIARDAECVAGMENETQALIIKKIPEVIKAF